MKIKQVLVVVFSLLTLSGCSWKSIEKAQNVTINSNNYTLEVARTEEERKRGLSNRKTLDEQRGMIFYYDRAKILSFWMKDTLIPLQIIFINGCKIVDIQEMATEIDPSKPHKTYKSSEAADKAIELNSETAPKNIVGQEIEELCDK